MVAGKTKGTLPSGLFPWSRALVQFFPCLPPDPQTTPNTPPPRKSPGDFPKTFGGFATRGTFLDQSPRKKIPPCPKPLVALPVVLLLNFVSSPASLSSARRFPV